MHSPCLCHLKLIEAIRLPAPAALHLATHWPAPDLERELANRAGRLRVERELRSLGFVKADAPAITWPDDDHLAPLLARLERLKAKLLWRGRPDYPSRVARRLGDSAPEWFWLVGPVDRLSLPGVSIVGSRRSPPRLLSAASRLAEALSAEGISIISGMAAGADTAAHAGVLRGNAACGRGGTIAIPALGLLRCDWSACLLPQRRMTGLALHRPGASFSAWQAIRRNHVIAALGRALVLVASDLRGGSMHAVQWAVQRWVPVFCFEAGARTPPANRQLIRSGAALPLPLSDSPAQWVAHIVSALGSTDSEVDAGQPADVWLPGLEP